MVFCIVLLCCVLSGTIINLYLYYYSVRDSETLFKSAYSMSASSSLDHVHDFATQLASRTETQRASSDALAQLFAPSALSSPRIYRLLLASFYHVFRALEEELETKRLLYPKISPIYFRELLRTNAFERDLMYYYATSDVSDFPPPSPAATAYVAEMRAAIEDEPTLLISYCHSLYLCILYSGTFIQPWLVNSFGLSPPTGVATFDFSETISDTRQFERNYADAINRVSLTTAQRERIIEQKKRVFECNDDILNEVCSSKTDRRRIIIICMKLVSVLTVIYLLWRYLFSHFFTSR